MDNTAQSTIQHVPRMIIDPFSQVAITAENLKGDEELALPLSIYLWRDRDDRDDRNDVLRLFLRSSSTCGAMPLITSRGEGLKLAIVVAMDGGTCVKFDKARGTVVALLVGEPDCIVQSKKRGS